MTNLATYVEDGDRPAVRFERTYDHPVERVWAAVTEPHQLRQWFPATVTIDLRVGGPITFSDDPSIEDRTGTILACDPPRTLAFTWGAEELRFELARTEDGRCRFTLTDVLSDRSAAARQAAGWSVCLDELDTLVAGGHPAGPHAANATAWQPLYDTYRAAGMPSGAPIPGVTADR
jgi:uncharacterized protein YndB with AHSA1/START domain